MVVWKYRIKGKTKLARSNHKTNGLDMAIDLTNLEEENRRLRAKVKRLEKEG